MLIWLTNKELVLSKFAQDQFFGSFLIGFSIFQPINEGDDEKR
jgi:hypothetical protein